MPAKQRKPMWFHAAQIQVDPSIDHNFPVGDEITLDSQVKGIKSDMQGDLGQSLVPNQVQNKLEQESQALRPSSQSPEHGIVRGHDKDSEGWMSQAMGALQIDELMGVLGSASITNNAAMDLDSWEGPASMGLRNDLAGNANQAEVCPPCLQCH